MRPPRSLTIPLSVSLLLHVALVFAVVFVRTGGRRLVVPQVYKVQLVAAPAGERATGVVTPPKPAVDKPAPPRPHQTPPKATMPKPKAAAAPLKATASTPIPEKPVRSQEAPKAGGGEEGGKGADVITLKLDGLDFPYPWYLENITNQIMRNFLRMYSGPAIYRADVQFFIMRDGSVKEIHVLPANTQASYEFKVAASGSIEIAGKAKSFGKLPDGYPDDVLTVVFSFDKRVIK